MKQLHERYAELVRTGPSGLFSASDLDRITLHVEDGCVGAAYVASLGPGPAIPHSSQYDYSKLSDEEIAWKADGTRTYQELTRRCLATLVETTPLTAIEPDRKRIEMPDVIPLTELKKRGA